MVYCTKCGKEIPFDCRHCIYCGAENRRYYEFVNKHLKAQQDAKEKEDALKRKEEELKQEYDNKRLKDQERILREKEDALKQREEALKREYENKRLKEQEFELQKKEDELKQKEEALLKKQERSVEYRGAVEKCPHCGCVLQGLQAKCPECGFEFNYEDINKSLYEFQNRVQQCENKIASEKKTDIKTEKTTFLWVFINIIFLLLPVIIRSVYRRTNPLRKAGKEHLSEAEKQEAYLIENYIFPSDKKSILEALLFIQSKITFIEESTKYYTIKTKFWVKQWVTKARDLKHRADMSLGKDDAIEATYDRIIEIENRIDTKIEKRAKWGLRFLITYLAILIAGALTLFILHRINKESLKDKIGTQFKIVSENVELQND